MSQPSYPQYPQQYPPQYPQYGAYGPPPKNDGPNWLLIIGGVLGGGALLFVLVCCGGILWLSSAPTASAKAKQPFEFASVPVPALPDRDTPLESPGPGIVWYEVPLGPDDGTSNRPGHGGVLWVYLPQGNHAPGSLPCVLIAPAGSTLMEGMSLVEEDMDEHLPYVRAGFAVVAYELDGSADYFDTEEEAYNAFKASRAGLVNARNALEYTLAKIPEVNPKQVYTAGHSSAGTTAILFAEHEPRVAGCIAYAPCVDIPKWMGFRLRAQSSLLPGLVDFVTQSSPQTHESRLNCPLFLFHADQDDTVPADQSKAFADRLRGLGKDVTLATVPGSEHYETMIQQGIPKGIEWLKQKTGK